MTVTTPIILLLLLIIPIIAYIGWPRNRFRRTRDSASLMLRVIIVTLVVLALAGVQVVRSADRLAVVFLVDVSDSMGTTTQEEALNYIRASLDAMNPDDLAAVVAFGADAQVARSMSTSRELGPIRAAPNTGNTNIASAIRLGLALFPGDAARRMVILSDGLATMGDTEGAAQLAAAAGVEISYVPFTRPPTPEVQMQNVTVPTVVDENQEFDMTITIASEEETPAIVTILDTGEIISRQEVNLRPGVNNYTLRLSGAAAGFRDFLVSVDPQGEDGFYQNNQLGAFTRVEGTSRVLVVSTTPLDAPQSEIRHIVPALQQSGLEVDVITPNNLPMNVAGLAQYESIVLANVSALNLSNQRMQVIDRYVSDLGGGLVVVGGPQSYGPGGYFRTPLEDTLPVEVQIQDQERLPQLTIAYVVDRSGSMGATVPSGATYMDLAKEAMIRSIEFLQPTDRAGVASFDTNAYWMADLQDVYDRRELQRLIASLRPSGGTSIMAGMQLVGRDIIREPSELKHILLLTDGGADPGGLVDLTRNLYENFGVTTSVISIGGFEARFLRDMAQAGGGNYHYVPDAQDVPAIFALETVLATRSYIQEQTFVPTLTAVHPIMQNINTLPQLEGYVATTPRAAARVIMRGPEPYNDPLLVAWQYGLGRSVAFTSDATARWGQHWITWDDFSQFWSQAVRWTITEGATSNLETRVEMEDEHARIIVDARNDDGSFLNGLNLQASIVYNPTQSARRVQLRQVAPGRYEATFTPNQEGAYLLRVTNQTGQPDDDAALDADDSSVLTLNQTTGWVMSYSPEYEIRETDETLLAFMADLTGGRNLSTTPESVFEHNLTRQSASVPLWPWLLLAAMLLLPFDVGVRRLLITQSDVRRFNAWVRSYFVKEYETDEATAARLSTLRQARDRARHGLGQHEVTDDTPTGTPAAPTPASTISALRRHTIESREQQLHAQGQMQQPTKPSFARPKVEDGPKKVDPPATANIGARLLKRRKGDDGDE